MTLEPVVHKEFLVAKYIAFLKKQGVPPFLSSLIFGTLFVGPAILFSISQAIPMSFGYISCLSWLFIGPFMIYKAGQIVDELWPNMVNLLSEIKIKEFQSYEKSFHGRGYLIIGLPLTVVVSALILVPQSLSYPILSMYTLFYLASWIVLALLGSIGIWGTFQLILLIWNLRECEAKMDPHNSDGFGGLGFLADFGIKATVMYSTGALMIPMVYDIATRNDPFQQILPFAIIGSVFFSLSVLLSFLIQLFALNRVAAKGKNRLLETMGKRCTTLVKAYEKKHTIDVGVQILVTQGLFNQIYQMRVYPWDVSIILKLTGSMVLPIALGTIRVWLPWVPMF
jgi:hypothetical protein